MALWCNKCNTATHVMICSDFNSAGQPLYYAHNEPKNNEILGISSLKCYYTYPNGTSCENYGKPVTSAKVIHLSALDQNKNNPDTSELHDKVSVSADYVPGGETVQITLTPDPGYKTGKVTVTEDISGKTVAVTGRGNSYSFKMPHTDVSIQVEFVKQ